MAAACRTRTSTRTSTACGHMTRTELAHSSRPLHSRSHPGWGTSRLLASSPTELGCSLALNEKVSELVFESTLTTSIRRYRHTHADGVPEGGVLREVRTARTARPSSSVSAGLPEFLVSCPLRYDRPTPVHSKRCRCRGIGDVCVGAFAAYCDCVLLFSHYYRTVFLARSLHNSGIRCGTNGLWRIKEGRKGQTESVAQSAPGPAAFWTNVR
ncbi:hypothetical protein L226DRAFT_366537 [Lentinus tigrinus ALCF2SS1-7]|uniref:uncharacterized protein n=1 Tax=Lentinus tigrinus ALCF2SS1-7 TaxID=1328758 RepID=UPI0011660C99|nr:hypothetical protein L226DRAFT_366537 [Lentinus tigrinus ALCF2SS1-7]